MAATESNSEALESVAHSLKGGAASLSAERVRRAAERQRSGSDADGECESVRLAHAVTVREVQPAGKQ